CMTGHPVLNQPPGGWPSLGAAVSRIEGPTGPGMLPFVSLSPRMRTSTWADPGQPGFAGQAHAPFCPNAEQAQLDLNGISLENLRNRRALLDEIDRMKREAHQSGALEGLSQNYQ